MKSKVIIWLVAMFFVIGAAGLGSAQDDTMKSDTHKNTRTLTGCLQKGDSANEYKLLAQGAVNNATMHGMKEDAKGEAKEHGMGKSSTEHGHMTITDLSMVSESCQR